MPTRTPNRSRSGLTREAIARAALELADRDGLEALTVRRLAAELGVGAMTLYGYFRSKEELLDAIVEVGLEEIRFPEATDWRAQLREIAEEIRKVLVRHPSGMRIRYSRPILTPGALRVVESAMRALTGAGFSRADAARAYRTVFLYTMGFATFAETAPPAELERHMRAVALALPPDEYPKLTAAASELGSAMSGDAQFRWGLERLLDGIATLRPEGR